MYEGVRVNVLLPLLGKVGTAVTAYLVGQGINPDLSSQVSIGLMAVGAIAFDLLVDYARRIAGERKVAQSLSR